MPGPIGLVGSGEFLECSDVIDRHLLSRISGRSNRAVIIPTAAGQEGRASVDSWIDRGAAHFERLGLEPVPLRIVDRPGAEDPTMAAQVADAAIIYYSGGNPAYVAETMSGSLVWAAVCDAWSAGAALAGCSAGAMMMGSVTASPRRHGLSPALGVFDRLCVLPHFDRIDRFRSDMPAAITSTVPDDTIVIGIDEETALVVDGTSTLVLGRGQVWHLDGPTRTGWSHGEPTTLTLATPRLR